MARKQFRVSERMLFIWCMLLGFIFLFAPEKLTNKFQFAFANIFRLPLSVGRSISLSTRKEQPLTDQFSQTNYEQLQNHLANLTVLLEQEKKKVEKLSKMRSRFFLEGAGLVVADIITASISGSQNELIINRGKTDGLMKEQFVLGDNGVVGVITYVDARKARIRLLTDSASKIPVKIGQKNLKGILQGAGNNSAKIRLIPISSNVKVGDYIYARQKPGFLDGPMIIGKVSECRRADENPLLWDISVRSACNIPGLSNVTVIVMNPQK